MHRTLALGAGLLEGIVGLQGESARFSALGDEAFVPPTCTRQSAAFLAERWTWGDSGHLSAGVHAERVRVQSDGDAAGADAQLGARQRVAGRCAETELAVAVELELGPHRARADGL